MIIFLSAIVLCLINGVFAALYAYSLNSSKKRTHRKATEQETQIHVFYIYIVATIVSNLLFFIFAFCDLMNGGNNGSFYFFSSEFIPQLITLTFICGLILILLPIFRSKFHSRVCALLWIFLSGCTWHLTREHFNLFIVTLPFHLRIPENLLKIFFTIWSIGFIGIYLYHIIIHFHFRHRILKNAREISYDDPIFELFKSERKQINFDSFICPIYISKAVSTPLSIGLFHGTTCIVLPDQTYDEKALSLIFRHELIHISRRDSMTKLFMNFFTALFWFNPLMWLCQRQCADDMELSCDEAVLADKDTQIRKKYANLLLKTAADSSGFTSCLSGSAKALQYRLKNIIIHKNKKAGGLIIGLFISLTMFFSMTTSLAYSPQTLADAISNSNSSEKVEIYKIEVSINDEDRYEIGCDKEITESLLSHTVNQLVVDYGCTAEITRFYIYARSDTQCCCIEVHDKIICLTYEDGSEYMYYTPDKIDIPIRNPALKG